jgi:hypothetical protein
VAILMCMFHTARKPQREAVGAYLCVQITISIAETVIEMYTNHDN